MESNHHCGAYETRQATTPSPPTLAPQVGIEPTFTGLESAQAPCLWGMRGRHVVVPVATIRRPGPNGR